MCLAEGKVVAVRIANHIEPHHNDPIRFWNGKLQSLCARICHESRKKFVENRGRRNDTIRQSVSRPGTIVEEFCQVVEANIL